MHADAGEMHINNVLRSKEALHSRFQDQVVLEDKTCITLDLKWVVAGCSELLLAIYACQLWSSLKLLHPC